MELLAKLKSHAVTIVVAAVFIGAIVWFKLASDRVSLSIQVRLATVTANSVQARFRMPPARTYNLVLMIPEEADNSPQFNALPRSQFSGRAHIREGTNVVAEFEVSSLTAQSCNWLLRHGFTNAWILTWHQDSPRLYQVLKPDRTYEVSIEFQEAPPRDSSLWMSFAIRNKDRHRAKNLVVVP